MNNGFYHITAVPWVMQYIPCAHRLLGEVVGAKQTVFYIFCLSGK